MKRLLLLAIGAMVSGASFAQEEVDVTSYIQNAGFEEGLTWQTDGSKKATIGTKTLSDRSIAAWAEDGTLYATVNPNTPKNRPDGQKLRATNGFVGAMPGWEWVNTNDADKPNERIESKACEWVYFGNLPYDLKETAVPVADDGTTYLTVPARPTEFDGGDAALYLRAGWGNAFAYKQNVKLPCAVYRLEYWTINVNQNTSASATDLSKIICRKDVFQEEGGAALTATEWTKHSFEFTPTSEFTIQFGFQAGNGGSGSTPWVFIDGIKLYKIGEADRDEINQSDMNDLAAELAELAGQATAAGYEGLAGYIGDYTFVIEEDLDLSGDNLENALKKHQARTEEIKAAIAELINVDAILEKLDNYLKNTDYAGKAALQTAYEKILAYKENDVEEGEDRVANIMGAVEEGNAAIKKYIISQQETASEANPASFDFFVQQRWFINPDMEPTVENGIATYAEDNLKTDNIQSDKWYIAGSTTGGDQNAKIVQSRTAWNAWATSIQRVAVAQDLTDMPNGYYTVEADLITQAAYANQTQVAFVQSSAAKAVSPALQTGEWDSSSNAEGTGAWTTLKTEKVLVVDGKLTIGAEGYGNGATDQSGWFCATNFKLNFVGKASEEEINAAVKTSFDAKLAEAKTYAEGMFFAADKKALNDSIAKYEAAADKDAMLEAIKELNAALTTAEASQAKYYDYLPEDEAVIEGKTLRIVKITLDESDTENYPAYGEAKPIAQFAYDYVMGWMQCDTATYTALDATVDLLKNYVNTYVPAYQEAAEVATKATETGKNILQDVMNKQKAALISEMKSASEVNDYVATLKEVVTEVKKQNIWESGSDDSDYTAFIINPNAEAENGWDFEKGNGDKYTTSSQWFDGSDTRYFDSYNSGGLKDFKASQLVKGLPNGTYKVGVYARTAAEGAYIFVNVKDTTFVEIPLDYYTGISDYSGEDTTYIASDQYGPIWEEAQKKIVEEGILENDPDYMYYYNIYNANNGKGRGWKHMEIDNVVVDNHELLIGSMTGTEASQTEKVYAGAWYSFGGWTLTLLEMGDNTGWTGPLTAINTIENNNQNVEGIYTITGVKTNSLKRGMNIIVRNGKATKILVK